MKRVLHAGCGGMALPPWPVLAGSEVRLDIDPRCKPDIVADIADMGDIGEFDTIFCCHALEHLYPRDVKRALREFIRVLKPGGLAVIMVPNLDGIKPTNDVIYQSPGGPITGHDMYYGKEALIELSPYMAHHSGFVPDTMLKALQEAEFPIARVSTDHDWNLFGFGARTQ